MTHLGRAAVIDSLGIFPERGCGVSEDTG